MRTSILKNVVVVMALLCVTAITPSGCSSTSSASSSKPEDPAPYVGVFNSMDASVAKVHQALTLNPDGTVSMDITGTAYAALTPTDITVGRVMTGTVNAMVYDKLMSINPDFSINWLGPSPHPGSLAGVSCKYHLSGVTCSLDPNATYTTCEDLQEDEVAATLCDLFPIDDEACLVLDGVAIHPLEIEACYCANNGSSSTFNLKWWIAAAFTCN